MRTPRVLIGLMALALAGCGLAAPTPTAGPARIEALEADRAVVRIHFRDRDELDTLARRGVDLFENVDHAARTVDASLTPKTTALLQALGVRYEQTARARDFGFPAGYGSVEAVQADIRALAARYPTVAQTVTLGTSVEGRPVLALRLTAHPEAQLPGILVTGGNHARELPPVELVRRLAHHLAEGHGQDATITRLLDTRDVWLVPVVNPDGRVAVEGGSSMWRKNRRNNGDGTRGVDTNRNADDHWSQGDADSSADDFRGSAPFSEPESRAIRDLALQEKFAIALDIHNYGGMILWPPGYTRTPSKDEATFRRIGDHMAKPLGYRAGTIATTIYTTFGDMATWMYTAVGTLAYGVELNDRGFSAPYSQVDADWKAWKDHFLYLIEVAGHPATDAPVTGLRFSGI